MRASSFLTQTFAVVLFGLSCWLSGPVFADQQGGGLELVMIERQGCAWCRRWTQEVAPVYGKTEEGVRAPLRRHDLAQGQPAGLAAPAVYTPTFALMRDGAEIGRITGYVDDATFWGLLGALLKRADGPHPQTDVRAP